MSEQFAYEINEENLWRADTPGPEGWTNSARPDDPDKYLMISADTHVNEPHDLWAKRIRGQATETDERIRMLYEAAFSRMPSELEMDASLAFLTSQAKLHGVPEDNDLPWKDLVHAIINAKEFIYLN